MDKIELDAALGAYQEAAAARKLARRALLLAILALGIAIGAYFR